jgi:hypothetical protein
MLHLAFANWDRYVEMFQTAQVLQRSLLIKKGRAGWLA